MSVLIVCDHLSGRGGMETTIHTLFNHLKNKNVLCCVALLFSKQVDYDPSWESGIEVIKIKSKLPSLGRKVIFIKELSRLIKARKVTRVICTDPKIILLIKIASVFVNKKIMILSWIHFSTVSQRKKYFKWLKLADKHLVISKENFEMLKRYDEVKKAYLIHNATDEKEEIIPAPIDNCQAFLYLGRVQIEGQKQLRDMLHALSRLELNWVLHIIGDGNDRKACMLLAEKLGIAEKITWHGWQNDSWSYIINQVKTVSALLLSSKMEGMPMVLIEAMSYGIPCISSDCKTGPSDIIVEGKNGYLYQTQDVEDFVRQLNKFSFYGVSLTRDQIKASISDFYFKNYFEKIDKILELD